MCRFHSIAVAAIACCTISLAAVHATVAAERGEPWPRHVIDNTSRGADGVRLADVNGDGLLDIATGWEEGSLVRAYLHPGPGRVREPWPAVTVGQVGSPEDAVFADVNGDGVPDVVSCCEGKVRTMYFHLAPTDAKRYLDPAAWRTEPLPASADKAMWMFCLPLDIDGQHGIDLVAGAKGPGAEVGWFQAPANPVDLAGWKWRPLMKAGWIMSLLPADIDGDGKLDLVVSDRRGAERGVYWLGRSTTEPTAAWHKHPIGGLGIEVMFLDYADLDGDGRKDVVVAVSGGDILFLRREGAGTAPLNRVQPSTKGADIRWTTHAIPAPANCGTGKSVRVADIDLDGRADLVYSCENASGGKSGVVWMSYDRSPTDAAWQTHEVSGPQGVKFDLLQLVDLDADGDLDIITCEERDNLGLIWYENPTRSPAPRIGR